MSEPIEKQKKTGRLEVCEKFVRYLEQLRDNDNGRAVMADFRRDFGKTPEEALRSNRYLAKWVAGDDPKYHWLRQTRFCVASLFGTYPDKATDDGSLGSHLAALCTRGEFRAEAVERHLSRLIAADRDDLDRHLYHIIRLLQSKEQAVNWAQLMKDLWDFDFPERAIRVKYRWSHDFWSVVKDE